LLNGVGKHIPLIGKWIATAVEKIEEGIEGFWNKIESTVNYLEREWNEFKSNFSDFIHAPGTYIWNQVKPRISEEFNFLYNQSWFWSLDWEKFKEDFIEFIKDPAGFIRDNVFPYIESRVRELYSDILGVKDWVAGKVDELRSWIEKELAELRNKVIGNIIADLNKLRGVVDRNRQDIDLKIFPDIGRVFSILSEHWESIRKTASNIALIDWWLSRKLQDWVVGRIQYELWAVFHDLFTLEYDLETGEVIGKYTSPVSMYFIEAITRPAPEFTYPEDVSKEIKGTIEEYPKEEGRGWQK